MRLLFHHSKVGNFGDELNRLVWPQLAPNLFCSQGRLGLLGIGTIIGMKLEDGVEDIHVFSSGAGYDDLAPWRRYRLKFWCVRGPLTAALVGEPADCALTDGAILVPGMDGFPEPPDRISGTVVIPHCDTLMDSGWDEAARMAGMELLDPRADPAQVIARILSANLVLTESLHGAILADCFGVPWIAFATSKNFSVFKWMDWTLSMELPLMVGMIRPPAIATALRFGRTVRSYGKIATFTLDDAKAEYDAKVQAACNRPRPRPDLKRLAVQVPGMGRLLGFEPGRTAEALLRLAKAPPILSDEPYRQTMRERMLERFERFMREVGAAESV